MLNGVTLRNVASRTLQLTKAVLSSREVKHANSLLSA